MGVIRRLKTSKSGTTLPLHGHCIAAYRMNWPRKIKIVILGSKIHSYKHMFHLHIEKDHIDIFYLKKIVNLIHHFLRKFISQMLAIAREGLHVAMFILYTV